MDVAQAINMGSFALLILGGVAVWRQMIRREEKHDAVVSELVAKNDELHKKTSTLAEQVVVAVNNSTAAMRACLEKQSRSCDATK